MNTAVKTDNISKTYPGVLANSNVSITINASSIHAVVGENGAGKSTLMKILYGMIKPDSGNIEIFNNSASISSPKEAINLGIGMVHQHFMLAKNLTVLENIILGIDRASLKNLGLSKYKKQIQEVMKTYSLDIDLNMFVDELSVGEKQRVEIIKVLFRGAKILILDEPTAVLVPQEVKELFKNLEDLKNKGFDQNIISSIDSLSRRRSESYTEYIERLMQNKISVKIKLLDLADNIKIHSENNDNGIYDAKIIQYKNALKQRFEHLGPEPFDKKFNLNYVLSFFKYKPNTGIFISSFFKTKKLLRSPFCFCFCFCFVFCFL